MNTIYRVFQSLMDSRNLRAIDVSKYTGIDKATLSRWKHNKNEPKLNVLIILSDYFGVPVDVFVEAKRKEMKNETKGSEQNRSRQNAED